MFPPMRVNAESLRITPKKDKLEVCKEFESVSLAVIREVNKDIVFARENKLYWRGNELKEELSRLVVLREETRQKIYHLGATDINAVRKSKEYVSREIKACKEDVKKTFRELEERKKTDSPYEYLQKKIEWYRTVPKEISNQIILTIQSNHKEKPIQKRRMWKLARNIGKIR